MRLNPWQKNLVFFNETDSLLYALIIIVLYLNVMDERKIETSK